LTFEVTPAGRLVAARAKSAADAGVAARYAAIAPSRMSVVVE
jgi:hypothetical protein